MYRVCVVAFGLFLFTMQVGAQSEVLEELKDGEKTARQLYFYPSTLRMLNLNQNQAYYDLIKGIRKVIIFRMKDFTDEDFQILRNDLRKLEGFEEYAFVDGETDQIFVLGRTNPANLAILTHVDGTWYITEVQGSLNLLQLPELYESLSRQDSTVDAAFINFFDISGFGPRKKDQPSENEESQDTSKQNQSRS